MRSSGAWAADSQKENSREQEREGKWEKISQPIDKVKRTAASLSSNIRERAEQRNIITMLSQYVKNPLMYVQLHSLWEWRHNIQTEWEKWPVTHNWLLALGLQTTASQDIISLPNEAPGKKNSSLAKWITMRRWTCSKKLCQARIRCVGSKDA